MTSSRLALATAAVAVLAALGGGCVSKKTYDSLQAQLDACQKDKQSAQDASASLQRGITADNERWEKLSGQLGTVMPQVQQDLEQQRKDIISMVPQQVQAEVGARLDRHFVKLTTGLRETSQKMDDLKTQLEQARAAIAQLQGTTQSVESKVDATHEAILADDTKQATRLQAALSEQQHRASDLVGQIMAFDKAHLTCADCAEKLKMKDTSREALVSLHQDLVKGLSALQTAGVSGGASHPAAATTPAAPVGASGP